MKTGITFSCFDLLHAGHILMLEECKTKCDRLIVGLQTDPTIDRPEKNKPIQSLFERFIQLSGCKYVDEIIPYTHEYEIDIILQSLNPSIRFIGEEYAQGKFSGKKIGSDLGIELFYNTRNHNFSSTELRGRIKGATK